MAKFLLVLLALVPGYCIAAPLSAPGDMRLRFDLQLLNDNGVINVPMTTWPLSNGNISAALNSVNPESLPASSHLAYQRVREHIRAAMAIDSPRISTEVSAASGPRFIRTFEATPRDEGEIRGNFRWIGDRFTVNLSASAVANPFDGDEFRPDGTYVGVALGNWMLTAGWQERWWGPGRDGSLILSTNARPTPGIAVQRNLSNPFATKWLRWMGPWTFTSFMTEMDDERVIENAWLFGVRGAIRPPNTGLEIGVSRLAQWCGDDRPCELGTFADLLVGNDNQGVNVNPEDEPGNQLGGVDIRWQFPKKIPVALYMQWIGEDGRGGGGAIGAWLRQLGVEHWGEIGGLRHRTHIEASDSTCRQGGFGFSGQAPNCAYAHSIYNTGLRYEGRSIAHSIDGDGLSYSLGSTLVQSAGHSWNISLRYMEINRVGATDVRHTISPTASRILDAQVSHQRVTKLGLLSFGLGFEDIEEDILGRSNTDVSMFVYWRSH